MISRLIAIALLGALCLLASPGTAGALSENATVLAQTDGPDEPVLEGQETSGASQDDGETEAEVRRIVIALITLAAVTTCGLIGFVWHTSPRRRRRAALAEAQVEQERIERRAVRRREQRRDDGAVSPEVAAERPTASVFEETRTATPSEPATPERVELAK